MRTRPDRSVEWHGRMVRRNSLLGRALEGQKSYGEQLPGYGPLLAKIAASDQASPEFDRVVARAKPASTDEFAGKLLHLVVLTALEASMAAPRDARRPKDGLRESVVVGRRAAIGTQYEEWFGALDVLEGAFGIPQVRVLPPVDEPRPQPAPAGTPGFVPDDCPELQIAMEQWRVALGHAEPLSDDPLALAWRDHLRFRTEVAPDSLRAMREHLEARRRAELASLSKFPSGRNQGRRADRKAFTILLSDCMKAMTGSPRLDFVTTLTTILFGEDETVYSLEGTQRLLSREAKRNAPGRS